MFAFFICCLERCRMFDFIRNHSKTALFVLFLLVVPSFILIGTGANRMTEKTATVATVDGKDITQSDWDAAHENEARAQRAANPQIDPKVLDTPEARYTTLEAMVRDRVLAAAVNKQHLSVSDARVVQELQQNQVIASLRKADGTLDMDRYRQLAAAQGMTPEMLEAGIRRSLSLQQVSEGLGKTGFSPKAVADRAIEPFFEHREVRIARFKTEDYLKKVAPTDAEVEQFYKDNPNLFRAPEQADIEYVVLDLDAVKKTITVDEAALKAYYDQNAARLAGKEERRASHILIAAAKDASPDDRAKAKTKAEHLLAEIKKAPQTFAELAKKNSQDPGSAANGGDLDFFSRGAMTKNFEDAVFSMKKGDVSNIVETEFGYHIIQLTDVKLPKQKSFEESRPEIETEYRAQQAAAKFAEAAETFTNLVYEQSDSLKPVADKLKLAVKSAQKLGRQPSADAKGALASRKLLDAVFSPDATEKKRNTEAVEVGPNELVAARIVHYNPARTLPFAEVSAIARGRLVEKQAQALAIKEGKEKLAAWQANPASAVWPESVQLSREDQKAPQAIVRAALRADGGKLPAMIGVELDGLGYAVLSVDKAVPRGTVEAAKSQRELTQYGQWWSTAEGRAYYEVLKERFKVRYKVAAPALAVAPEAN